MVNNKVLLVDDDKNLLDLISVIVSSQGVEVFSAVDGIDGLEIFKKERPKLVIVDWIMKPVNGLELGKQILAIDPKVTIVAMTGMSDDKKKKAAEEAGFYHFISKPFNMGDLNRLIEKVLNA